MKTIINNTISIVSLKEVVGRVFQKIPKNLNMFEEKCTLIFINFY